MLMESSVDPFNAQETQPYRADPEIQAMTGLVEAYQRADIRKFERTLQAHRAAILEDAFIGPYVQDLMTSLRTQVSRVSLREEVIVCHFAKHCPWRMLAVHSRDAACDWRAQKWHCSVSVPLPT